MNVLIAPPIVLEYCVGECICGRDCHNNVELHRNTGALTQEEYTEKEDRSLASEITALRGQAWDLQVKRG